MNLSSMVLACTTLALGTASVYLYTELDAERARADAEATLRRDQEVRVQVLEARLNLPQEPPGLFANPKGLPPPIDNKGKSAAKTAAVEDTTVEAEPGRRFPGMRNGLREMLSTPEGREMMLNRQKMGLRMQYKDLARELNLSAAQADELITLLAEQQMRQLEKIQLGEGNRSTIAHSLSELQRQNETELMTLLGDKYLQYDGYQKSLGERMQVQQIGVQLEAANLPLNESQKKQLISVMTQERDTTPRPEWAQGSSTEDFASKNLAWQKEYNQRVRDRVANVLSPEQLKQFEELQQNQIPIAMPGMRLNGALTRGMRAQPRSQ